MGIEAPLMTDSQGNVIDDFYEMPNGCICCTVKYGILEAVEMISFPHSIRSLKRISPLSSF